MAYNLLNNCSLKPVAARSQSLSLCLHTNPRTRPTLERQHADIDTLGSFLSLVLSCAFWQSRGQLPTARPTLLASDSLQQSDALDDALEAASRSIQPAIAQYVHDKTSHLKYFASFHSAAASGKMSELA